MDHHYPVIAQQCPPLTTFERVAAFNPRKELRAARHEPSAALYSTRDIAGSLDAPGPG